MRQGKEKLLFRKPLPTGKNGYALNWLYVGTVNNTIKLYLKLCSIITNTIGINLFSNYIELNMFYIF